jgi:phosphoribosyl 1,2-cyclic phosphodiesterase
VLICDAGTGIIPLGNKLISDDKHKELLILLSHFHWDHISGLPFFVPAFHPKYNISFFGPGDSREVIKKYLDNQMKAPYFPVGTEEWVAKISYLDPKQKTLNYGSMEISYYSAHHPGITYGYKIKAKNKTIIYIPDNECLFLDKSIKEKMEGFTEEETTMFTEMNREEYEAEVNAIANTDILIHDAQYTPQDYEKKKGWGHSCYIDIVNMAIDAEVKNLFLFSHDPNNDDEMVSNIHRECQKIIAEKKSSLRCHIAKEGLKISLD